MKDLSQAMYMTKSQAVNDHFFKDIKSKNMMVQRKKSISSSGIKESKGKANIKGGKQSYGDESENEDCKFLNYCNEHGICRNGQCLCHPGWTNYDCSLSKFYSILYSF